MKSFLQVLLIVLLTTVEKSASSNTTCGMDIEKIRKRRVEAIRGQILSKLGLTHLPNDNDVPSSIVTDDVEAMYNRTRDFLREKARQKRRECEELDENYFAQDIVTIGATIPPSELRATQQDRESNSRDPDSQFFYFNLSSSSLDPDSIVSATMRLYQIPALYPPSLPPDVQPQKIELYQLFTREPNAQQTPRRFVSGTELSPSDEGWKSFDLTSTVREWAQLPDFNQGLEITAPCADVTQNLISSRVYEKKLKVRFIGPSSDAAPPSGSMGGADARTRELEGREPQLIVLARVPSSDAKPKRRKRSLDADYCFRRKSSEVNCCLRKLFIDFRRDLGWKWILAPSGYNANFCAGACPYLWSSDSQHSTILSLYRTMNPRASAAPCCAPKELEPLTIMYYERGRYKFVQLPEMVLLSCKCS